jgi:hypothetical protein
MRTLPQMSAIWDAYLAVAGQKPSLPLGDTMTAVNLDPPFTGSGYLSFE